MWIRVSVNARYQGLACSQGSTECWRATSACGAVDNGVVNGAAGGGESVGRAHADTAVSNRIATAGSLALDASPTNNNDIIIINFL